MNKEPLVSVVIPTYNRSQLLVRAINSVLKQKYINWELIIVDDGSRDNTKGNIQKYLENPKIKYFYLLNNGVCFARNYGIRKALGEYVFLLDSDDEFLEDKIFVQLARMKKYKAKFSISNRISSIDGKLSKNAYSSQKSYFIGADVFIDGRQPLSASFIAFKKEVARNIKFDEKLPSANDLDYILMALKYNKILFVDYILNINHKSLREPRISTNYKKKIKGYSRVLSKLNRGDYRLNKKEKFSLKKKLYFNLGLFLILDGDYVTCRKFLLRYLRVEKKYSIKILQAFFIYLLSFCPFLFVKVKLLAENLWLLRLLKI